MPDLYGLAIARGPYMNRAFLKIRTLVASRCRDRQCSLGCNTRATRARAEVRRAIAGFGPGSVDEADGRQADARRRAPQQGERGTRSAAIPRLGLGCADRNLRRAVSHAQAAQSGAGGADAVRRDSQGDADRRGQHVDADRRPAAVSRVRRRRRRDCAARLRELRHARRLQGTRPSQHRREGQDRHRPLRQRLARIEAEARAGARRRRLPHLFRSARGRLLRR